MDYKFKDGSSVAVLEVEAPEQENVGKEFSDYAVTYRSLGDND